MLTGPYARYGTILLGVLLVIYAIVGLEQFVFTLSPRDEKWTGGIVGLITGVISAATGVQVVPSMPYFQAIGMEKDELVQALGVFFTVATLALAFNLSVAGVLDHRPHCPASSHSPAPSAAWRLGKRCARGLNRMSSAAGF